MSDDLLPAVQSDNADSFLSTKEVQFRTAGTSKVSVTTYMPPFNHRNVRKRNAEAYFGFPLIFSHPWASPYKPAVLPPSLFTKGPVHHLAESCLRFTTTKESKGKEDKEKEKQEQQDDNEEDRQLHAEHYAHTITSDRARQPYSFTKIGSLFSCVPFVRAPEADEGVQHAFALSNTNIYAWRELFPTPISPFFLTSVELQPWLKEKKLSTDMKKQNFYIGGPPEMPLTCDDVPPAQRTYFDFALTFITQTRSLFSLDALGIPLCAMLGWSRSNGIQHLITMDQCLRCFIYYIQCLGVFKKQNDALRCAMEMSHHYLFLKKTPWAEPHTMQILEALQVGERLFFSILHDMKKKANRSNWVSTFLNFDRSAPQVLYTQSTGATVQWKEKHTASRASLLRSLLHRFRTLAREFVAEEKRPGDTDEDALRAAIQPLKDVESEKGTRLLLQAIANICVSKPTALLKDISMVPEKEEKKPQLTGLSHAETAVRMHMRWSCAALAAGKSDVKFESVLSHCFFSLCLEFDEYDFNPALSLARVVQSLMNQHRVDFNLAVAQYLKQQLDERSYFVDLVNTHLKDLKVLKAESA